MLNNKKCSCRYVTLAISGLLFAVLAIVHLLRAIFGWSIIVNGSEFPIWASWLIVVVSAAIAVLNFCSLCCRKCNECQNSCCNKDVNPPPQKTL